jgi:hypothetical protein
MFLIYHFIEINFQHCFDAQFKVEVIYLQFNIPFTIFIQLTGISFKDFIINLINHLE